LKEWSAGRLEPQLRLATARPRAIRQV